MSSRFLSRNYWLILAPWKFDVLKTNICRKSEASRTNMLVLRTSNFHGATIRPIVPRHSIVFIVHRWIFFASRFILNIRSSVSRITFSDWLRYSLSILLQIVSSLAVYIEGRFFVFSKCLCRRFRLKFWTTTRFILKQLQYSLSISMCDSWLGLHPCQLSQDRNLKLII